MTDERYSRNEALFGAGGQRKIEATSVAIIGLGGLGSYVTQQLAYLGVRDYGLVDYDVVTESSLNRLVGAVHADIAAGVKKVAVAERTIRAIKPEATINALDARIEAPEVEPLVAAADIVFGCVDRGLPRLRLTELCARYAKPLFDLASDTGGDGDESWYGGRVLFCDGSRCVVCLNLLDQQEMARDSMSDDQRAAHDRIYGIARNALDATGPMVVSVNGAVASIAITEFMVLTTGMREPKAHLNYYADRQIIRAVADRPADDCYYCSGIWGSSVGEAETSAMGV